MSGLSDPSGPSLHPSNPGITAAASISFSNAEREWTEEVQAVDLLVEVLKARDYSAIPHDGTWLEHPESGYLITPRILQVQPLDAGGVRTITTIQVNHPTLAPEGLFEYQHSTGDDVADSIRKGFDQWVQVDFVTLLDAALPEPKTCTTMVMSFPEKDGQPARHRRAILGPVAHLMVNPPPSGEEQEHPFCACCLLTNSFEGFKELFESDAFLGLRLFAMRNAEGTPMADCRVNGEDHEPGAEALRQYAQTWPEAGYEFRKQYVVLQSIDKPPDPEIDKSGA